MNGDDQEEGVHLLHRAYSLGAPDTHIDFYRDFAELYDSTFAASLGYIYPLGIASVLSGQQRPQGAILDIGCGTGLVATAIRKVDPSAAIDGVDISPDMLGKARAKGELRGYATVPTVEPGKKAELPVTVDVKNRGGESVFEAEIVMYVSPAKST